MRNDLSRAASAEESGLMANPVPGRSILVAQADKLK